ncbi:MAG: RluA family pseudouridine synthase [Clostridia bacterium]|nr:RluA family pseudouridine synthase [Clostridia bacterium]
MTFTVNKEDVGARLDAYLAKATGESRSAVVRAIDEGRVEINGSSDSKITDKKYKVALGDVIVFTEEEVVEYEAVAEDIPLDIIYEDDDIIVINKPSGMVVHPAAGNFSGTLVNALLHHCRGSLSGIGGVMRPGIVHRIDKDTSGLLVVAKNDFSHRALSEELEHHGIVREYHALVNGGFKSETGTVNMPIGRHPVDRKKMAVLPLGAAGAKSAITHYEVISSYGRITYLKLILETGRTHQIRVHMSHTGHPLLGDTVYGGGRSQFEKAHAKLFFGQALHAKRLTLTHPRTKERMTFESPLPNEFEKLLEILNSLE